MRPHLRCDCRHLPCRRAAGALRRRNPGHDQPRRACRRDPRAGVDHPGTPDRCGAQRDPRDRLRTGQFPLAARRCRLLHPQPVDRYRPGRRRLRQQGRGRRRPGHDVRLCLHGHARTDAGADLLRAPDPARACPRRGTPAGRRCSAPMPRARSPCNTSTASRCGAAKIVVSIQHSDNDRAGGGARDRAPATSSPPCPRAGCATRTISSSTRPAAS